MLDGSRATLGVKSILLGMGEAANPATREPAGDWARVPDEGDLVFVHPGLQLQTGVFPERRNDETEDQRDADKDGGKDDLRDDSASSSTLST